MSRSKAAGLALLCLLAGAGAMAPSASAYYNLQASTVRHSDANDRCEAPCVMDWQGFARSDEETPNDAVFWEWSFPGGVPSSGNTQDVRVTYNRWGVYQARLTATWASGRSATTTSNGSGPVVGFGGNGGAVVDPRTRWALPERVTLPHTFELVSEAPQIWDQGWSWENDGDAGPIQYAGRTGPDSRGFYRHLLRVEGAPLGRLSLYAAPSDGTNSYRGVQASTRVTGLAGARYRNFQRRIQFRTVKRPKKPATCTVTASLGYRAATATTAAARIELQRRARRGSRRQRRWRRYTSRRTREALRAGWGNPRKIQVGFPFSARIRRAVNGRRFTWRLVISHEVRGPGRTRVWRRRSARRLNVGLGAANCGKRRGGAG